MARHTTFRYCLDPTVEQQVVLVRHAGAARFAFNQCLRMVKDSLTQRCAEPTVKVPWSGFDLINTFNAWKKTEDAGRVFAVDAAGDTEVRVTGLAWRNQVYQQVLEEAAVDCGRALAAWSESRGGTRRGKRVGFPRFKRKASTVPSFRLRNKQPRGGKSSIRVGDAYPRSITLPGIGTIKIHNDTRPLRRLVKKDRARVLSATVSYRTGRWWLSVNVEAAELHPARCHPARPDGDHTGWVGIDRGLSAFVVGGTADGREIARIENAPKALAAGIRRQRYLDKTLARKQKGSHNRREAAARLGRHHARVANIRSHFLHEVSNGLVKTHDRLVIEDLNVRGMMANHRLARAIGDAGWSEFGRQLRYKQSWRRGAVEVVDRWYPSSQLCSVCDTRNAELMLADRTFSCPCGYSGDRDLNAAVNLARWAETKHSQLDPRTPKRGGRANNARRRDGADRNPTCFGETSPNDTGTDVHAASAP
jgi:putative transposase